MGFNQREKNQLISQLQMALDAVKAMPVNRDCHTCANYDLSGGPPRCRAAGIAVPPHIVEIGCEAYIFDHTLPPF